MHSSNASWANSDYDTLCDYLVYLSDDDGNTTTLETERLPHI